MKKHLFRFVAITLLLSVSSARSSELQKVKLYDSVVYNAIVNWGEYDNVYDEYLENQIAESGLLESETQFARVFKYILWEGFDGDDVVQKWLSKPSTPLDEKDWFSLREIDETIYASVKAYYIFATTPNSQNSTLRLPAIERLRGLKSEMLAVANFKAVAIVSAWLGNELQAFSYIDAIAEFKYAFNHLEGDSEENSFQVMLTQRTVAAYLSNMFSELQLYSSALAYGEYIFTIVPLEKRTAIDYIPSVQALTHLEREQEALQLVNELIKLKRVQSDKNQYIIALILNLSVFTNQNTADAIDSIKELAAQIKTVSSQSDFEDVTPMINTYLQLAKTVSYVLEKKEEVLLSEQIQILENQYYKWAGTVSSSADIKLRLYQNLQRIYELKGNYENAYSFAKKYQQYKRDRNETLLSDKVILGNDVLAKDAEIIRLKNNESLQDKERLTVQANFFKNIVFGLVAVLLTFTTFWYRKRHRNVKALADTDSLTGALTRRAMYRWISYLPEKQTNCAVLIDIDFFKHINDQYGHLVGDEVIKGVSETIQSEIRKIDKLCRYGGEEFLIVFSGSGSEDCEDVIARIRSRLATVSVWGEAKLEFNVEFSAGIVNFQSNERIERILERADRLLYIAKTTGRARTVSENNVIGSKEGNLRGKKGEFS